MKILFFGDSITDAGRTHEPDESMGSLGWGFVRGIADRLQGQRPDKYEIINRGIGGNRVVDLYARIKKDVWNIQPDVLSILIGVNDIWHELDWQNGVDIVRFENVYRMMIKDTQKVLPNTKIVLCEPFVLKGRATNNTEDNPNKYARFCEIYEYAKVVKKLAEEYGLYFLPLQEDFTKKAGEYGVEVFLYDGVHPMVAGATLIADKWVDLFKEKIEKNKFVECKKELEF